MNRYEVRISGKPAPIQVRACRAHIALSRALRQLSDSNFLNTTITIKLVGRVGKVYRIRGVQLERDSDGFVISRRTGTFAANLPSKDAAESELARLRTRADLAELHIKSGLEA